MQLELGYAVHKILTEKAFKMIHVMYVTYIRLIMQNIITCIIGKNIKNIKFKSLVISEEEKWYVIKEGSTYVSF